MSTLPIFERTVLLWGPRWWIAGRAEPLEFQHEAHAVEVLAAQLVNGDRRVAVRLVFQPETLASGSVICPRGNRHAVQLALSSENPALEDPERAWGYEPILPIGDEHSTVLYQETEPALFNLVAALAERGIDIVTAWPLATFLHALPGDWSESGAVAVLAVSADRALAYHHPAEGTREVREWRGTKGPSEALAWLAALPASPGSKLVVSAPSVEPSEGQDWPTVPLGEALGGEVMLPRVHPAQLIPPAVASPVERVVIVAAAVMLLAGIGSFGQFSWSYWIALQQADSQEAEIAALSAEIAHLQRNAAEITRHRQALAGRGPGAPIGEFLDSLGRGLGTGIAISVVRTDGEGFRVAGFIAPGATERFAAWHRGLADNRWRLEPITEEAGKFSIQGRFAP